MGRGGERRGEAGGGGGRRGEAGRSARALETGVCASGGEQSGTRPGREQGQAEPLEEEGRGRGRRTQTVWPVLGAPCLSGVARMASPARRASDGPGPLSSGAGRLFSAARGLSGFGCLARARSA